MGGGAWAARGHRWAGATALLLATIGPMVPTSGEASPLDAYGFGARSIALGGAATALATDYSAAYYNPAAFAAGGRLSLEVGYSLAVPALELDGRDAGVASSRGVQGGVTIPGELFGHAVGASLALFLPDGLISRVRTLPQAQPRFALYDNRPQRLMVATSVALELLDDLYLGAGLTYIASTSGTLDVQGTVNTAGAELTRLSSAVDVTFSSVRYPTIGVLFTPGSWRFGLNYRHEFVLELDLDVRVSGDITVGEEELLLVEDGLFLLDSFNTDLFSPRQLALGVAYEGEGWSAAVDVTWSGWSRFPAPVSTIELTLDLGDLDFAVPVPDRPDPPGFRDVLSVRAGVELSVLSGDDLGLTVRAGAFAEPSPAPDQPGRTNYVDGDKWGISAGLGVELPVLGVVLEQPLVIDLAVQSIRLSPRTYRKTSPADPIGDYRAGGSILGAAASMRISF